MKINFVTATALLMFTCLAACSRQDAAGASTAAAPAQVVVVERVVPAPVVVCNSCGVVRSVTAVTQEGRGTGAGAVIGGIVGGVAGNQVGGGSGKKIATVAGVIGGAVLGNEIEQNRNTSSWYDIVIDMESGGEQFITVQDPGSIGPGSLVSVQGNNITLR